MSKMSLYEFCKNYSLEIILDKPTCYKNSRSFSYFHLMLTNQGETFLTVKSNQFWLSDFQKMVAFVF